MKNRVVTISREFGSGGRTIGQKLAEELGIPCYEAELIQQLAQESGFSESYIRDAGEYAPGGYLSLLSNRAFSSIQKPGTQKGAGFGLCLWVWLHQYMPPMSPPAGMAGSFSGMSATRLSVVRTMEATEAAFSMALRQTLVGSTMPSSIMSPY